MPKQIAVIDAEKCRPEQCPQGICQARPLCPNKILVQEAPYQTPFCKLELCRGCFKCLSACPMKAISKM